MATTATIKTTDAIELANVALSEVEEDRADRRQKVVDDLKKNRDFYSSPWWGPLSWIFSRRTDEWIEKEAKKYDHSRWGETSKEEAAQELLTLCNLSIADCIDIDLETVSKLS